MSAIINFLQRWAAHGTRELRATPQTEDALA
jgi:hypothetical protein